MPGTTDSLEGALKTIWNEETMAAQWDMKNALNRQLYSGGLYQVPINLKMTPSAIRERKQRQLEMNNQLARVKRGNKPSYRQRQKNGRKAAGR